MAYEESIKVLYELPLMSNAPNDGVSFLKLVRFEYPRNRVFFRGGIRFKGVAAKRERTERCITLLNEESFNKLIEIENSQWAKEIRAETDEGLRDHWQMHHYMIFVNEALALEVVADSWELLPEEKGEWPKIKERTGIDGT